MKGATGLYIYTGIKKTFGFDWASLETKLDNLYRDKFETFSTALSKQGNVVDNVVKKLFMINQSLKLLLWYYTKNSGLVVKTQYELDKQDLEKKIEDVAKKILRTKGMVKKSDCNMKITEIENKISRVTGLETNATLNTKVTDLNENTW